ncbi:hypothetical protein BU24DRAFT_446839 [Aaosphaeria arxii CBS 175.79]|uniref:DUF6604 domain-containing protein n=1 Tax=Aaosphaeria arxii CBS 175.79 TaxID=1450172 RepID=A0A6A5Y9K1_9PLEO|nr:uncharacterized protein BU24DRAFT_446839 [Aaosphaeria arxii CBS 175.79]KAF2021946.1 hypothetical protein BU24DRAFT_446839 [Aaosphaeria arxii CBS 175.79]
MYAVFQQMTDANPDPEIERKNVTHKHFIDALSDALVALGGDPQSASNFSSVEEGAPDEAIFQNKFAALSLGQLKDDEDDGGSSEDDDHPTQTRTRKKKAGRGKKGKRSRRSKKKPASGSTEKPAIAEVPVESYRIIEDKDGLISDYLLAVYAVAGEWADLRSFTQDLWREVAYDGLNGAVAAALNSIAVSMVKQTCIAVFADFPGHESYDTIMQTITKGDREKAQTQFSMRLYRVSDCGQAEKVQERYIDVKEQLWVHAYDDLLTFVLDFQKNRTGKPTKALQLQLNRWSPEFDLQRATNEERVSWRRLYTISRLYDLVNVFSSVVVQQNNLEGEHHVYEDVDWSTTGPWGHRRRIFGLEEFAGDITALAMQKSSTDVRRKILPTMFFNYNAFPRRDVDRFLDRNHLRAGHGFIKAVNLLRLLLQKDANAKQDPNHHAGYFGIFDEIKSDFANWLGESLYRNGLATIPPSRFSRHNSNGLWEYSPLLCAAGLVEGLIINQRMIMHLWDNISEPAFGLHLHNMLVKKKYLKKEVGILHLFQVLYQDSFFPGGVPTDDFHGAFLARTEQFDNSPARERERLKKIKGTKDIHRLMDLELNNFFRERSTLLAYYDANWVPEQIPDSVIRMPSYLYVLRLRGTEREIDPATGEKRLKQTELVKRAKARGQTDAELLDEASDATPIFAPSEGAEEAAKRLVTDTDLKEFKAREMRNPYRVSELKDRGQLQGRALLEVLRLDIFADVCGRDPMSSLNYVWFTCYLLILFGKIEDQLREARNPLWVQMYQLTSPRFRHHSRLSMLMAAMANDNKEALEICAKIFDTFRVGAKSCIFWEDLRMEDGLKPQRDKDDIPDGQCSVM